MTERATSSQPSKPPHHRLLSLADVERLPPLRFVVEGVIPESAIAILYGASGSLKTFLALDLALSLSSGVDWQGHPVASGPVVYVAGEGFGGYPKRIAAWRHGRDQAPAFFAVPNAIQLLDQRDVAGFAEAVRGAGVQPHLIVIDTLNRAIVGGDENSQKDMSLALSSADALRREFGCAILIVHHSGKYGGPERGSGVIRNDADVVLAVQRSADAITLTCEKMRDAEPFPAIRFEIHEIEGSLVLRRGASDTPPKLSLTQVDVLELLAKASNGLRFTDIRNALNKSASTVTRATKGLLASGLVSLDPRTQRYTLAGPGLEPASGIVASHHTSSATVISSSDTAEPPSEVVSPSPLLSEKGLAHHRRNRRSAVAMFRNSRRKEHA